MSTINPFNAAGARVPLAPVADRPDGRAPQREIRTEEGGPRPLPATALDPAKKTGASPEPDRASLEKLAEEVNKTLNSVTSLNFSVDQDAGRLVVKVMDQKTVVRQIPSEEMLDLVKRMKEFEGLLFDAKA